MAPDINVSPLEETAHRIFDLLLQDRPETTERFLEFFDEDVVVHIPYPLPGMIETIHGKPAFRAWLMSVVGLLDSVMTLDNIFVDERRQAIVIICHSEGRNTRSGQPYANRYVMVGE